MPSISHPFNAYRPPERFTDAEGNPVVRVFLCDGTSAVADAADFDHLIALGVSPHWYPSGNGQGRSYVCVSPPRGPVWPSHNPRVNVARLIVAPFNRGQVVKYADGNRLNLRRSNLVTARAVTGAKAREGRFISPAEPTVSA